ncbi:MAG: hypothetical protein M1838_003581 [Thelocarpon superellum]|nr:MAG: hypothetical protein M1838_003581 [Thelocarpon superellum]
MKSDLDLINECDNFPDAATAPALYASRTASFYAFCHDSTVLGYITPLVVSGLRNLVRSSDCFTLDHQRRRLHIAGSTAAERSKSMQAMVEEWREHGTFGVLSGWRNELYAVYGPGCQVLFDMERAATPLFGVVTYGVHLTVFVRSPGAALKIWVPRRARTKQTYAGMLDNTVAGGIGARELPLESLVREAEEEASLPEELVRRHAVAVGTVTYWHERDSRAGGEMGLMQPECQYVYDLEVGPKVVPRPNDSEVEGFALHTVDEVHQAMKRGEFKPNCALVLLDFLVRHGVLTPQDEPDYIEIVARMHRRLEFPLAGYPSR